VLFVDGVPARTRICSGCGGLHFCPAKRPRRPPCCCDQSGHVHGAAAPGRVRHGRERQLPVHGHWSEPTTISLPEELRSIRRARRSCATCSSRARRRAGTASTRRLPSSAGAWWMAGTHVSRAHAAIDVLEGPPRRHDAVGADGRFRIRDREAGPEANQDQGQAGRLDRGREYVRTGELMVVSTSATWRRPRQRPVVIVRDATGQPGRRAVGVVPVDQCATDAAGCGHGRVSAADRTLRVACQAYRTAFIQLADLRPILFRCAAGTVESAGDSRLPKTGRRCRRG